jgi:hypothetical protein
MRVHEVHPVTDHRGFDLISDALPFGRLWYGSENRARIVFDCWAAKRSGHDVIEESCT